MWALEASKASTRGAESSSEVEALCRDLVARCAQLELELESKRKELRLAGEQSKIFDHQVAAIDDKIASARQARLEALEHVQGLTRMSANEVKALKNRPPRIVRRAIEAIYIVLHCQRWLPEDGNTGGHGSANLRSFDVAKEWKEMQRMLLNDGFVLSVLHFDVGVLDSTPHVAEYVVEKYFPGLRETVQSYPCSASSSNPSSKGLLSRTDLPNIAPKVTKNRTRGNMFLDGLLPSTPRSAGRVAPAESAGKKRTSMFKKSSMEALHADEPLDVAAVEYASRACGAMISWVSEVLREFFVLRDLRLQREAFHIQIEELGLRDREDAIAQIQEELRKLSEQLEGWRLKMAEMKAREFEAERARANLLKLSRLEERSDPMATSSILRAGRSVKLQPVKGMPVLRPLEEMPISPKPAERKSRGRAVAAESAIWPPQNRKYLHIMSSSRLP